MSNISPQTPEPLPDLLRSIVDQAQAFARAELEIVKIESKQAATKAFVALVVLTASGLLLALALAASAAAVTLYAGASATAALLIAAGVASVIAAVSTGVLISWIRKGDDQAEPAPESQLTNLPQHGSTVS